MLKTVLVQKNIISLDHMTVVGILLTSTLQCIKIQRVYGSEVVVKNADF